MDIDALKAGFNDELEKIAGELQGFTRIGRKPIGIERMLEKETEEPTPPSQLFVAGEEKEAAAAEAGKTLASLAKYKTPALLGAGAVSYHVARKANEDRKLGRQVRLQQGM